MKQIKKWCTMLFTAGFIAAMAITAYADETAKTKPPVMEAGQDENSQEAMDELREYLGEKKKVVPSVRGPVISHIDTVIEDRGFNSAKLSGEIACHHAVEGIFMAITLQKWDAEYETWDDIHREEFEWDAKDMPEGEDLSYATASYEIGFLEHGGIYRTKVLYGAWDAEYDEAWYGWSDGLEF